MGNMAADYLTYFAMPDKAAGLCVCVCVSSCCFIAGLQSSIVLPLPVFLHILQLLLCCNFMKLLTSWKHLCSLAGLCVCVSIGTTLQKLRTLRDPDCCVTVCVTVGGRPINLRRLDIFQTACIGGTWAWWWPMAAQRPTINISERVFHGSLDQLSQLSSF